MGCCGSSTAQAAASGMVLGAPPSVQQQQQQAPVFVQQPQQPQQKASSGMIVGAPPTQQPQQQQAPSVAVQLPQRKASSATGKVEKANAKYREGLSFSDAFFAAYECCVIDDSIKKALCAQTLGEDYSSTKDIKHAIGLGEGKITHDGGGFTIEANFQPIIYVNGVTTELVSVSNYKEKMSSMMEQLEMLHKVLKTIFPDAAELFAEKQSWATPMEAQSYGQMVSVMFAYAMGPTYMQAFLHYDGGVLFYCETNPGRSPYPPDQAPEDSIKLITKGIEKVRCLPLDAVTTINGWYRSASTYGAEFKGVCLEEASVKKWLEMMGIFEKYVDTYATWEWVMYTVKVGACNKEIRMLTRPRSDGTSTIEVLFTAETD